MVSEWGAVSKLIKEMKSQGGNVYRYILPKRFFISSAGEDDY